MQKSALIKETRRAKQKHLLTRTQPIHQSAIVVGVETVYTLAQAQNWQRKEQWSLWTSIHHKLCCFFLSNRKKWLRSNLQHFSPLFTHKRTLPPYIISWTEERSTLNSSKIENNKCKNLHLQSLWVFDWE